MALRFALDEQINAPPSTVFAVATDLERAGEWMPNFVGLERLTEGPTHQGTRWRETRRMFGREASEEFEVTGYEPPTGLELYVDGTKGSSKRGYYRFRYAFEPRAGGTHVTLAGEIGGLNRFMELIAGFFAGTFKKAVAKDLAALKDFIESGKAG